jgi:hypothetical protein
MIEKSLISSNPLTGAFTELAFDDATGEIHLINGQDITAIIESNKRSLAEPRFRKLNEDWRRVANIPMQLYMQMERSGLANDEAALKRWLNDADNRLFRTTDETV